MRGIRTAFLVHGQETERNDALIDQQWELGSPRNEVSQCRRAILVQKRLDRLFLLLLFLDGCLVTRRRLGHRRRQNRSRTCRWRVREERLDDVDQDASAFAADGDVLRALDESEDLGKSGWSRGWGSRVGQDKCEGVVNYDELSGYLLTKKRRAYHWHCTCV